MKYTEFKRIYESKNTYFRKINSRNLFENEIENSEINSEIDSQPKLTDFLNVGDILLNSWGYDETTYDFWKIISISKPSSMPDKHGRGTVTRFKAQKIKSMYNYKSELMPTEELKSEVINLRGFILKNHNDEFNYTIYPPAEYKYYFKKWNGKPVNWAR